MTRPGTPHEMITERARVLRVNGTTVWVHCESQAGCARCAAGEGCGGGLFSKLLRGRLQELPLALPAALAGAVAAGDWVLVGLSTRAVQAASTLLYGLPLAMLLAGAIAGDLLWPGDAAAFAGAVLGLGTGLLIARRLGNRLEHRQALSPVLLRRLEANEPCPASRERRQ